MMTMRMATVLKVIICEISSDVAINYPILYSSTHHSCESIRRGTEMKKNNPLEHKKTLLFCIFILNPFFASIHYLRYAFFFFHSRSFVLNRRQFFFAQPQKKSLHIYVMAYATKLVREIKKSLKLQLRKLLSRNLFSLQ